MADLVQDAAADIAKSHDWRALTRIEAIPAGVDHYPLPADYDRMVLDSSFRGLLAVGSAGDWVDFTGNGWIILGGTIQFKPALNEGVSLVYVSDEWARRSDGAPAADFISDDDEFVLNDRLLMLSLIWRYKEATGLEYAEDMQNFSTALEQEQGRDRGSQILTQAPRQFLSGRRSYSGRAI